MAPKGAASAIKLMPWHLELKIFPPNKGEADAMALHHSAMAPKRGIMQRTCTKNGQSEEIKGKIGFSNFQAI